MPIYYFIFRIPASFIAVLFFIFLFVLPVIIISTPGAMAIFAPVLQVSIMLSIGIWYYSIIKVGEHEGKTKLFNINHSKKIIYWWEIVTLLSILIVSQKDRISYQENLSMFFIFILWVTSCIISDLS